MLKFVKVATAALLWLVVAGAASAADAKANQGPYEVVVGTTQHVMKVIEEARGYIDKDPARYNREIEKILDDVVDFQSFARGVMGKYGSRGYYESLKTEEERAKFRENVKRFTENFKSGLINTYAKGLLGFNGNRIEVLPLGDNVDLSGSVGVRQHIYGERAKPYEVIYTLRRDSDGKWKLRNVVIEGLNLGRIYQNQFRAAFIAYNGNLDKVIDNWTVAPQEVMEKAAG
ncbi:MAG: ABC transporter substrate-binding protein [Spongiibacter sp.]|uniref:ABC transporter substrate-binding protein n=1 Tax=Spongiibacter thalassae TaxID=2721624 RepID=A0ABX1GIV1_9GAMM|nr:ABC transporter substrate-binding protein [Spongiibacter thalassae]MDX1505914.1 ABC transporter substrate-binding protein [Spongiibacter sp.]NKI18911.1 ABC transporter substrate-binding protein [Spongiibacter thalassae]